MVKKGIFCGVALILMFAITGCGANNNTNTKQKVEVAETFNNQAGESLGLEKKAEIINNKGKNIGIAILKQFEKGVLVQVYATGLKPGTHGFHIHTVGKCDPPKFETAGGHFNPTNKKHGYNNPAGYHAGDIANLVANKNGIGEGEFFLDTVTLKKGEANSLFDQDGSALMIHKEADDYSTDPAGNAGERVGCAVITE